MDDVILVLESELDVEEVDLIDNWFIYNLNFQLQAFLYHR